MEVSIIPRAENTDQEKHAATTTTPRPPAPGLTTQNGAPELVGRNVVVGSVGGRQVAKMLFL